MKRMTRRFNIFTRNKKDVRTCFAHTNASLGIGDHRKFRVVKCSPFDSTSNEVYLYEPNYESKAYQKKVIKFSKKGETSSSLQPN